MKHTFVEPHEHTRTDMVSDVMQAVKAVLLDHRGGALMPQIQWVGLSREEAVKWLREAADELEKQ